MTERSPRPRSDPAAVTVLVVDDQPVMLRAAHELVAATEGFQQVGEAQSGAEALGVAERVRPDLVLMDIGMLGMDGVEASRRLVAALPETLVVLISLEGPEERPDACAAAAAGAHVRKQDLSPGTLERLWHAHVCRPAHHA